MYMGWELSCHSRRFFTQKTYLALGSVAHGFSPKEDRFPSPNMKA